jgi:hypothetical protein
MAQLLADAKLALGGFTIFGSHLISPESRSLIVMAGLVPAIHAFPARCKNVDARDKPAHDDDR